MLFILGFTIANGVADVSVSTGATVLGGLADGFVASLVSGSVGGALKAANPANAPDNMHQAAFDQCNSARWMIHRAEIMMAEQNMLEKDIVLYTAQTKQMEKGLESTNSQMQKQIDTWRKNWKTELWLTVLLSVVMVVIFVMVAVNKGITVRHKLEALREVEMRAEVKIATES